MIIVTVVAVTAALLLCGWLAWRWRRSHGQKPD
jgi:hypothetical protein